MLVYHPESDSFFWDPHFEFEGPDGALCIDATEILWAVVVAQDRGIDIPDYERHLHTRTSALTISRPMTLTTHTGADYERY